MRESVAASRARYCRAHAGTLLDTGVVARLGRVSFGGSTRWSCGRLSREALLPSVDVRFAWLTGSPRPPRSVSQARERPGPPAADTKMRSWGGRERARGSRSRDACHSGNRLWPRFAPVADCKTMRPGWIEWLRSLGGGCGSRNYSGGLGCWVVPDRSVTQ